MAGEGFLAGEESGDAHIQRNRSGSTGSDVAAGSLSLPADGLPPEGWADVERSKGEMESQEVVERAFLPPAARAAPVKCVMGCGRDAKAVVTPQGPVCGGCLEQRVFAVSPPKPGVATPGWSVMSELVDAVRSAAIAPVLVPVSTR